MPTAGQDTRTLEQALRETAQAKWQGRRCYATNMSQADKALRTLALHMPHDPDKASVASVSAAHIRLCTSDWYAEGLSPATINKRLNCLSAMGVSVEGCRVREPKVLKWWLKPEDEERVCAWLVGSEPGMYIPGDFADLIRWTTHTGLRIEESLRLDWGDIGLDFLEVTVPGLKTATAQATLPLGDVARGILARRHALRNRAEADNRVFLMGYDAAQIMWGVVRKRFGWQDNPTATLKALRRSAARHLHVTKGMPLDLVRTYLRHEDVATTLSYLRLTGGYSTEEMRKWL